LSLIEEISKRNDSTIIFPRGFGKTTWEKIDTIHDIVYGIEPVILYVSDTLGAASFHFESIKTELENNELLRIVYSDLVPPNAMRSHKWTNAHFETTNGINMIARGVGKGRGVNIKNQRPTKIILDDIENDENVRSLDQRKKLKRWVNAVVVPSKDPMRGFIKMIGTTIHRDCFLLDFYNTYGGIFRKAIENGESIWPEIWTIEKLEDKKRKIGSTLFNQEYMNEPRSDEDRLVKEKWIKILPAPKLTHVVGAIDPAISQSETADNTSICSVGRDDDGRIWVLDNFADKLEFSEQINTVFRKHQIFNYFQFGVEQVAYQQALQQELVRQSQEKGIYLPVVPVKADKDKVRRLQAILPLIENGTIVFSETLPPEFFDELLDFPQVKHDDRVDSFVHAVNLIINNEIGDIIWE